MSSKTRALIGLLVSGVFVWLLVKYGDIKWAEAWQHIRDSDKLLLLASSAASTVIFAIRVPRWRILLPPPPPGAPPLRFLPLFQATVIGQMATNVVGGRAGEVARPYALSRIEPSVPFSTGFASVVVDRVFDGIVVLLLLLVAMLAPEFPRGATIQIDERTQSVAGFAFVATVGLAVGLTGLFVLVLYPLKFIAAFRTVARLTVSRLEEPVGRFLERFAAGLTALRDPKRFSLAFGWAVAHWVVCAWSYWLAYKAVGLDAPVTSTLFVQTVIVLAVALPSTPGFVGIFETFAIVALAVYGVPGEIAAAWAIIYHVISYIPVTALGIFYSVRMGVGLGELKKGEATRA